MRLLSLSCAKWSDRDERWNLFWKRMWETSSSHFFKVSTDDQLKCDVLDVLKKSFTEFGVAVYSRPAVARAVASGIRSKLYDERHLDPRARISSTLIMTKYGVVKDTWIWRIYVKNRRTLHSWSTLRELVSNVIKRGVDASKTIQKSRSQLAHFLWFQIDAMTRGESWESMMW